jgi:hypothetical protein
MISSDLSNGGMSCSTPACESSRNIGFLGALGREKNVMWLLHAGAGVRRWRFGAVAAEFCTSAWISAATPLVDRGESVKKRYLNDFLFGWSNR